MRRRLHIDGGALPAILDAVRDPTATTTGRATNRGSVHARIRRFV
jgi:hypothetical protein